MTYNIHVLLERLRVGYLALHRPERVEKPEKPRVLAYPEIALKLVKPEEREKPKPEKKPEGLEIEPKLRPISGIAIKEERENLKGIELKYPLIPKEPKKGERVFAYAHIRWDPKTLQPVYEVVEPAITLADKELIEKVKAELEEKLDVDLSKLGVVKARDLLRDAVALSLKEMGVDLDPEKFAVIMYYIERDLMGLGKIEPLMADPNIEDLSCDGVGIPIYVYHRDPRLGSIRTNVVFNDPDELNRFVIRLAQKCNKTISIAEPLLDGALPDGSRVQATLGSDIARKGSNFTIRKFTEKPLTPAHMIYYNTLSAIELAYLWLAVEYGQSILISGGTATGKTSLLNVLSLFIRPTLKVVSIEDTAELRLYHPHWIPHVSRTPLSVKGRIGEVTLFDLLKSSLRQRPDYIIVGEVRGKEAYVLFQQMATGHPSLATIHAASIPQLIDRLVTPPISLPPSLLENIDIVVFLTLARLKGRYVRRADSILEITGIQNDRPVSNKVFAWNPAKDEHEIVGKSVVLKKIAKKTGVSEEVIKAELVKRRAILEWMYENGIYDYKDATRIIHAYYTTPERVLELVGL
ncbi:MAG: type IV secretion system protein VirB11 [Candidatus Aenigmatarchaeota archaeon]|nr:MAG: type IV secretion system protein VirB11 [Candidatus Aenigmarchaeota archaeon]